MLELNATQGSQAAWVINAANRIDGSQPTQFLSTDALSANVWRGQNQTQLFAPTVSWNNYATGTVNVSVAGSQTTGLDAAGDYYLDVWATRSGSGASWRIIRCLLRIQAAVGTANQLTPTYAQYGDLLLRAPWITMVQQSDTDQEGFYSQRLEARNWLDWLIVRSWRGTSAAYFGDAGRSAQFWLGSWVRRTPLPSWWLINQLAGGFVMSGTVTAGGSNYTNAVTVNVPAPAGTGPNNTAAVQATISAVVTNGQIASLFVTNQGSGYTIGSTLTLTFTDPYGSGATATATVSSGTLILRDEVVRIVANKAISLIGLAQVGLNNQLASYGAMHRDQASAEVMGLVAELDLNGDGVADLPIPISPTNTMFT